MAMNPCPCGHFGDPEKECSCSPGMISRYQNRISGPILDRIDIHLNVLCAPIAKRASLSSGELSRVIGARHADRYARLGKPNVLVGDMGPAEVQKFCALDEAGRQLLRTAAAQMNLSARGYHRVLKLAWTIADLAGEADTRPGHLAEALQYRPRSAI